MRKNSELNFFDISSELEVLPKNELFRIKGGNSDVAWTNEMDPVDVPPPSGGNNNDDDDDPWGWDPDGPDDDGDNDDLLNSDMGGRSDTGGGGGGGGGYTMPVITNPSNPSQSTDPFVRDSDGKIISTPTGRTTNNSAYGVTLILEEHQITAKDGTVVTAYKVDLVFDPTINELRPATQAEKSNCFGLALLDGDFWFGIDDQITTNINESTGLETILNTYYETCSAEDASLIVCNNDGFNYHAGIIDVDGTITAKGGTSEQNAYNTVEEFRGTKYTDGDVIYYKLK